MPELPDLEIHAKNLNPAIAGRTILSASIDIPAKANVPDAYFRERVESAKIQRVSREGKELAFWLSNGNRIQVHFMLFGRTVLGSAEEIGCEKKRTATLRFEDGGAMAFIDDSRMLKVSLNPPAAKAPDALDAKFTLDYFLLAMGKNSRMTVKGFLLKQSIVRGIGNAYSDEILYAAGISPLSVVGKIPAKERVKLYDAISSVLSWAIDQLHVIAPDIISGEERSFLKVHNRDRTHTDAGEEILIAQVESKNTFYVRGQTFYM